MFSIIWCCPPGHRSNYAGGKRSWVANAQAEWKCQFELNFYLHIQSGQGLTRVIGVSLGEHRDVMDGRNERKGEEGRQWTWPTWVPLLSEVSKGNRVSPWPAWVLSFGSGVRWLMWNIVYGLTSKFPRSCELMQAWDPELTVGGVEVPCIWMTTLMLLLSNVCLPPSHCQACHQALPRTL